MTKLSVSLSPADVAFIDSIAVRFDGNRSAAIHDLVPGHPRGWRASPGSRAGSPTPAGSRG